MDTELEILVRAVSDEKSADDATKQIVSRVFSKLKDGAIKLPINSKLDKADLKKLDDSMRQARKEVVSRYNKLLKDMDDPKGFDAFSDKAIKDLVELGKAYTTFNSKASGKSKNSLAAISEVKAALGEVFQLYENESRRLNSKIKELNLQDKVAKPLPSTRSKKSVQTSEALDRYYDKQQKYSEKAEGAKKRNELFRELKEVRENQTPKGVSSQPIGGVVTARTLHETEHYGSYSSAMARQMAQSKKESLANELTSLKVERNRKKVEEYMQALEDRRAKTKITVPIDRIDKKNKLHTKYKDIQVYNNKPREQTEEEANELKRDVTTNELAKILGGIEHNRPDVSLGLFKDYLEGAFIFNESAGKNPWKAIQEVLEKTLNRYRGDKGTLGITDGTPKGESEGHQTAIEAIKLMLDYLGEKAAQSNAEEYRQQRILMKIDPQGAAKAIEDPLKDLIKKLMPPKSDATTERNSILSREIQTKLDTTNRMNQAILSEVNRGRKLTGIQLSYDKVENARESLADAKESQIDTTHKNISRDVARAVKKDTETGFNTDTSANALIDTNKQILDKLTECFKVLQTKPEPTKETVVTATPEVVKKSTEKKKTTKTKKSKTTKKPTETKRTPVVETKPTEEKRPSSVEDLATVERKKARTATYHYKPISLFADMDAMRIAEAFTKRVAQASATHTMLQDTTRLALPKADGRRKYPSKGLIDETPIKHLPLPIETNGKILDIGAPLKTLKEDVLSLTKLDIRRWNREDIIAHGEARRQPLETDAVIEASGSTEVKKVEKILSGLPALIPGEFARTIKETFGLSKADPIPMVNKSEITSSPMNLSFWDKLEDAMRRATGATEDYSDIINSTADKQDQLAAERIKNFGLNNGRNPNDTGDIASIKRALELFRSNKRSIYDNPELLQRIRLTSGRNVNTTQVVEKLSDALSGKQMRNAQMGGSIPRQILGAMTGFVGMPSIEKSRAQADGLNQILGNINKALQSVLTTIQMKETELSGMEKSGQAKFSADGRLIEGTSAAKKTLADLEESKLVLDSILADMEMVDVIVGKTGGKFSRLARQLSFTSPVLRENNTIIRHINSGLDKNGKALKYQSRLAEIMNYTFQLMSRSIGQMFKAWMVQLNPITQIRRLFDDFASYNVKWQRTMNVVKYNLRDIILPIMDKIAQLLVNMIGFVDIILQKIQAAFGQKPISLFDQENAKKYKDEVEEIQSISAGFDELHDIGSDSDKDATNLLGDIYTPELSQKWIDLANRIGRLFAGIIKGDLGFGEVMTEILRIAWQGITTLWSEIVWPILKDNWTEILTWILGAFLVWKGLNVMGEMLWKAIFGKFTLSSITGLFGKVGTWITTGISTILKTSGISMAFQTLLTGGKFSMIGTIKEMFTNSAAITQAGGWGSMIGFAIAKGIAGALSIALGGKMLTDAFDSAADKTSYNIGVDAGGGSSNDKKGIGWDVAKGALGGAAIGFGIGQIIPVIGPLVGAAVGAVAGTLTTVLAPAFEAVEVASRNANNEMQKIEYYEGQVEGYSSQVQQLELLQRTLNDTVQKQIEVIYNNGEQLGITRTRLDELITSVQNGTFTTDMLSGAEKGLTNSLLQLDAQQEKNRVATEKLEAAKRKLQKAELELAIAEDVAAGNFEMAAARIEYAVAAELMTVDEGTKKMVQIAKEGSAEQAAAILRDLSPDLQKKFQEEYGVVDKNLDELTKMYYNYSKDERKYFLQNLTGEVQEEMQNRVDAIGRAVQNAPWYLRLLDIGNDGKIFGQSYIDVPGYATGTNYVPSDGLAYLHKGEAVIPAKYNEGVGLQGKAYQAQAAVNNQLINAITRLENTVKQGITVNGQFTQKGSDLVAVVNRTKSQTGADLLSNVAYAR